MDLKKKKKEKNCQPQILSQYETLNLYSVSEVKNYNTVLRSKQQHLYKKE